jgi:hypothetical protein
MVASFVKPSKGSAFLQIHTKEAEEIGYVYSVVLEKSPKKETLTCRRLISIKYDIQVL